MSLREVPTLPLKAGRHITAWVRWHTARVSLGHTQEQQSPRKPRRAA